MKKLFVLLVLVALGWTGLSAQQNDIIKLVTPQMSQKMFRTIKVNPNITQLMYGLLDASSALDGELKIESIAEEPDSAKNALVRLCAFFDEQGGEEYMEANLLRGFHFSARETLIAKAIYSDYKKEQLAQKNERELQNEKELIRRWNAVGKDVFEFSSEKTELVRPQIQLNVDQAIEYIDSITANPTSTLAKNNNIASVEFTISENGEIENFNAKGKLGYVFSADNFKPQSPVRYHFAQLDTVVPVPCRVKFAISEGWKRKKEIEIEIKYDRKKGLWKISSYDPDKKIDTDDLHHINRFLESLPENDPLRSKKHSLCVSIGDHGIRISNKQFQATFPLSPQCRIVEDLQNKSSLQKFGEAHLNW